MVGGWQHITGGLIDDLPMRALIEEFINHYAWIFVLAMSGGITSFTNQVWIQRTRNFTVGAFMAEMITASFAGIIAYFLCQAANVSPMMQSAFIGISGHMGTRFLYAIHGVICDYVKCDRNRSNNNEGQ